jgi:hypothetical protein
LIVPATSMLNLCWEMRGSTIVIAVCLALLACGAANAAAATLQPIGTFEEPIYVTSDPGNPEALFVVERQGRILKLQNGTTSTFADLRSVVDCCGGETGLLSIALAPDFDTSGLLYVDYTGEEEPGEIHVAELRAASGTAPLSSLRQVLPPIPHPVESNHYGGQLQFGPEGNLFISTGDGGGSNDQFHNAQKLSSLLGKILRINPHASGLLPYTVPAGNPFAAAPPYDTIWSLGLRNPFRFSFDQLTGDLWIGDVGQSEREEVDLGAAPGLGGGANYGWNCREGRIAGPETDEGCGTSSFVEPVFDYPHANPGTGGAFGSAIIGGYVVRDHSLGDLYGRYLYGDLSGPIRSFSPASPSATDRPEGLQVSQLDSFGEDSCGRLYAVSGAGAVYRIVGAAPADCAAAGAATLLPSYVGIKALRKKVKRNKRALITVWISPCAGRRGQAVTLMRGHRRLGTRRLSRACSVHFRPQIRHRWVFRASIKSDGTYVGDESRRLKIQVLRRHPVRERRRRG